MLCRENGIVWFEAWATVMYGWAMATQGRSAEGRAAIQQSMAAKRSQGSKLNWPMWQALLAQAYVQGGESGTGSRPIQGEGLLAVREGLAAVKRNAEHQWEAELYRLKGVLLLQQSQDDSPEAERCFQQALTVAHQQDAKSWELRTATSLARLWQQQGKTTEAHALLAPVYEWFTEGFDTVDLQEAKALLAVLA